MSHRLLTLKFTCVYPLPLSTFKERAQLFLLLLYHCIEITTSAPHWSPLAFSHSHAECHVGRNSVVASRKIKERTFLSNGVTQQFIQCRTSHITAWHQFAVIVSANIQDAGRRWMLSGRRHSKWEVVDLGHLVEPLCGEMGSRRFEGCWRVAPSLSNIHFCAYNCSSSGPVSLTPPPRITTNSSLTRINKATACWENMGLLQITARKVDLPQTRWKISAGCCSDASLVKKDTWAQVELLSLDISPSLLRCSIYRQSISFEVSAFCYLLSNALVWVVKN